MIAAEWWGLPGSAIDRHSLLPLALFPSFGGACCRHTQQRVLPPTVTATSNKRHHDLGAAYGTAKTGVGIASMGVMRPDLAMRNIIPVVMAGVLGIYALIV
ncbi:hypothetical protein PR003_g33279, partial [Phytophthora rubi]